MAQSDVTSAGFPRGSGLQYQTPSPRFFASSLFLSCISHHTETQILPPFIFSCLSFCFSATVRLL